MLYPIAYVFLMSVFKTNKLAGLVEFSGFQNYVELFRNPDFWFQLLRTIIWTAIGIVGHLFFGMVFALLLNRRFTGRKIARMLLIVPWAAAIPISAMIWKWVFDPEFGLLNYTLKASGLWTKPPAWLGTPISAFTAVMWVDIWVGIPFVALVLLAGMQGISIDLYESAEIDGAGHWASFWKITVPGIYHIIIIATLLTALWTFNDFTLLYAMTGGGPLDKTHIFATYTYVLSFRYNRIGYAMSVTAVMVPILVVLIMVLAPQMFREE